MTTLQRPPTASTTVPVPPGMSTVEHFARASAEPQMGVQLRMISEAAPGFREWFATTGRPDFVATFDLVVLPYPTRYGLFRAALTAAPYLSITNRLVVIRWREPGSARRTLLWEPSDVELDANTPFFADLAAKLPSFLERFTVHVGASVTEHLHRIGIRPEAVDYIAFDHLHTQDVRRWIGTDGPAPDISPDRPVEAAFPNARMIVQREELAALRDLHPLQRPWYQPATYTDLVEDRVLAIDGDILLAPGVALLATPGHTIGNQSLVLNTDTGIWVSSENAIAAECLVPEHSRIPGMRRATASMGQEVVINANTIESTAAQYNSIVKEKLIADRSRRDPRFPQFFPSSELTRSPLSPGTAPTFVHGGISHGALTPA